jgi:hypothetical protein
MFENGSYLRRRKRFKLLAKSPEGKTVNKKKSIKSEQKKSSFSIDSLLGNETNISCPTSPPSSSDVNNTLQQLLFATDIDIVKKLKLLNEIHAQQQQVYW